MEKCHASLLALLWCILFISLQVKIWDDRKQVPLSIFKPHDGQPVYSVAFLTAPERPNHINLITAVCSLIYMFKLCQSFIMFTCSFKLVIFFCIWFWNFFLASYGQPNYWFSSLKLLLPNNKWVPLYRIINTIHITSLNQRSSPSSCFS